MKLEGHDYKRCDRCDKHYYIPEGVDICKRCAEKLMDQLQKQRNNTDEEDGEPEFRPASTLLKQSKLGTYGSKAGGVSD